MKLGCPSIPSQTQGAQALHSHHKSQPAVQFQGWRIHSSSSPATPTLPSEQGNGDHAAENNSWQLQIPQIKSKGNERRAAVPQTRTTCAVSPRCVLSTRGLIPSLAPCPPIQWMSRVHTRDADTSSTAAPGAQQCRAAPWGWAGAPTPQPVTA